MHAGYTRQVLIIDDDRKYCRLLASFLEKRAIKLVRHFDTCVVADERLIKMFDIVLLSFEIPAGLFDKFLIASNQSHTPVYIMTTVPLGDESVSKHDRDLSQGTVSKLDSTNSLLMAIQGLALRPARESNLSA
jgi:DNA-binding NtrC family response regulator